MNLSVIVPSRNRLKRLKACLNALLPQLDGLDEVLVIENNSELTYREMIGQICKNFKSGAQIKLVQQSIKGKSRTRNKGLEIAKNPIVCFLDDDCLVGDNWADEIKEIFADNEIDFVLGRSIEKNQTPLIKAYQFQYLQFFLKARIDFHNGQVKAGSALNTRNCAVRREFLKNNQIRFDTRYDKFGFGEDTDFGHQLTKHGGRGIYSCKASVLHHEPTELITLLSKRFRNGRAIYHAKKIGSYQDINIERTNLNLVIEGIFNSIRDKKLIEKLIHFIYLNLIIWSYKLGFYFELIYDQFSQED